jgi:hypothetical protein
MLMTGALSVSCITPLGNKDRVESALRRCVWAASWDITEKSGSLVGAESLYITVTNALNKPRYLGLFPNWKLDSVTIPSGMATWSIEKPFFVLPSRAEVRIRIREPSLFQDGVYLRLYDDASADSGAEEAWEIYTLRIPPNSIPYVGEVHIKVTENRVHLSSSNSPSGGKVLRAEL